MKALISQGMPILGSTEESGVISAPAMPARPEPMPKVEQAHLRAVDTQPLRELFVHDHGARGEAEPRAAQQAREHRPEHERRADQQQAVDGIMRAEQFRRARDGRRDELHAAPEGEGDELPDNDAEAPGGQDRIQLPLIEAAHDARLDQRTRGETCQKGGHRSEGGGQAEADRDQGRISAQGDEGAMGEVHDLHHAEDDQQAGRDNE